MIRSEWRARAIGCSPLGPLEEVRGGRADFATILVYDVSRYIRKLLGNARVVRWPSQHRQEYLAEFQTVAEVASPLPVTSAAE